MMVFTAQSWPAGGSSRCSGAVRPLSGRMESTAGGYDPCCMAHDRITRSLADTVDELSRQCDLAVERSTEMHRDGAADDAVLTETAVAVRTAIALECLTGISWDERLEHGGPQVADPAPPPASTRPSLLRTTAARLRR